jgi:TP901 family phage tail tape measure protein
MAQRIAYLEAVVGADITNFRREMRNVRSELGILGDSLKGIRNLGKLLTFGVTAPILAIGSGAVKAASDFDASMRNINSISGLTEQQLTGLSSRVLEFGASLRDGPTAAAEGLYSVFSAGWEDVDEAFVIMQSGAGLAEAGLTDLAKTTETLTTTLLAYGAGAEDAARYSDIWTATVQFGVGRLDDFTTAMGRTNSFAAAAGVSFQDFAGSVAFLTQNSLTAYNASTGMRNIFTKLLDPTKELEAAFGQLGVASGTELIQEFGTLDSAMQALIGTTDGSAEGFANLWGSIQAKQAALVFFNNLPRYTEFMGDFRDNLEGTTEAARAQQLKSFSAQIDILGSAVQSAGIAFGSVLLPVLTPIISSVSELFIKVSQVNPGLIRLSVAALAVAAAIGPVLFAIGSLTTPIGLVVTGVTALYTAFDTNFMGIATTVRTAIESVIGDIQPLLTAINDIGLELFGVDLGLDVTPEVTTDYTVMIDELDRFATEGSAAMEAVNVDIPVEAGWGLNHLYFNSPEVQQRFGSLSEFRAYFDETYGADYVLQPGIFSFSFDVEADGDPEKPVNEYYDRFMAAIEGDGDTEGQESSAVTLMFESMKTQIEAGWVTTIKDNTVNWVKTDFLPSIGDAGSDALDYIAAWFSPGSVDTPLVALTSSLEIEDTTPIHRAFKELVDGHIFGAIDELFPTVGTKIKETAQTWFDDIGLDSEAVKTKLVEGFNTVKDFVIDTGIPALSEGFGYVIGTVVLKTASLMDDVFSMVFGGGDGNGDQQSAVGYAKNSIVDPFISGVQTAFGESDVAADGFQISDIFQVLAGALVAGAGIMGLGTLLMGGGFGAAISASLGFAMLGAKIPLFPVKFLIGRLGFSMAGAASTILSTGSAWITAAGSAISTGWLSLATSGTVTGNLALGAHNIVAGMGSAMVTAVQTSAPFALAYAAVANYGVETVYNEDENAQFDFTMLGPEWVRASTDTISQYITDKITDEGVDVLLSDQMTILASEDQALALESSVREHLYNAVASGAIPEEVLTVNITDLIEITAVDTEENTLWDDILDAAGVQYTQEATASGPRIMVSPDAFELDGDAVYSNFVGLIAQAGSDEGEGNEFYDFGTTQGSQMGQGYLLGVQNEEENIDSQYGELQTLFENTLLLPMEESSGKTFGNITGDVTGFKDDSSTALGETVTDTQQKFGSLAKATDPFNIALVGIKELLEEINVLTGGTGVFGPLPPEGTDNRAIGGPVMRGGSYIVGERGPELFKPDVSGSIMTNSMLRSSLNNGGNANIYDTSVYIDSIISTDQLIADLNRRGIKLG